MKIVLCGGGTVGHIAPLIAVAKELRAQNDKLELIYIGERGGKFGHVAMESGLFDSCKFISAGKIRRYHRQPLLDRILDFKTLLLNIRDMFRLVFGLIQSLILFARLRPSVVFLKGGFVCVPASIGAKLSGATIITHDSDALPGLSNRFAAKFAKYHATGMPTKHYSYPEISAVYTGVPIRSEFKIYSQSEILKFKEEQGIDKNAEIVLVTGGSNGAKRLNTWAAKSLDDLMHGNTNLVAVFIVGYGNTDQVMNLTQRYGNTRLKVLEFTDKLYQYSAVADVIISRAGATTIAEFGAQKKALILVPNPDLTGGHQLKNAKVYEEIGGAVVVLEKQLKSEYRDLSNAISMLLDDTGRRNELGQKLYATLPSNPAAVALANLILKEAKK